MGHCPCTALLHAIGYCAREEGNVWASGSFPASIRCDDLGQWSAPGEHMLHSAEGPLLVTLQAMPTKAAPAGPLVLLHDVSSTSRRSAETKRYLFYFYLFVGLATVISLVTVIIAQLCGADG